MLNYLWAGMIIIGVIFGAFNGKMPDITNAALDSAKEAVTLCITMMGVMSFWVGMMEIATRAGIIEIASKKLRPLVRFCSPIYRRGIRRMIILRQILSPTFWGWAGRLHLQDCRGWVRWQIWRRRDGKEGRRESRRSRGWLRMRCVRF